MLTWIQNNLSTIIISAILLVIIAVIIIKLHMDKKKGKSSCGSGCAHCAMNGKCHGKK